MSLLFISLLISYFWAAVVAILTRLSLKRAVPSRSFERFLRRPFSDYTAFARSFSVLDWEEVHAPAAVSRSMSGFVFISFLTLFTKRSGGAEVAAVALWSEFWRRFSFLFKFCFS